MNTIHYNFKTLLIASPFGTKVALAMKMKEPYLLSVRFCRCKRSLYHWVIRLFSLFLFPSLSYFTFSCTAVRTISAHWHWRSVLRTRTRKLCVLVAGGGTRGWGESVWLIAQLLATHPGQKEREAPPSLAYLIIQPLMCRFLVGYISARSSHTARTAFTSQSHGAYQGFVQCLYSMSLQSPNEVHGLSSFAEDR